MTGSARIRSRGTLDAVRAVDRAFAAALYIEGDAALDTGASLLAAAPDADAELALRGREFVRRAWERGWQPADVVRIVRRDLDEPHVRILSGLIRDELARYERLPARWQGQLDELPRRGVAGGPLLVRHRRP